MRNAWSQWLYNRGITTDQLAERTGYSPRTIEAWRCGARSPRPSGIRSLALACGMTQKRLELLLTTAP